MILLYTFLGNVWCFLLVSLNNLPTMEPFLQWNFNLSLIDFFWMYQFLYFKCFGIISNNYTRNSSMSKEPQSRKPVERLWLHDNSLVSPRIGALLDAHVSKQTYALTSSPFDWLAYLLHSYIFSICTCTFHMESLLEV